jgi:hypothetical protein
MQQASAQDISSWIWLEKYGFIFAWHKGRFAIIIVPALLLATARAERNWVQIEHIVLKSFSGAISMFLNLFSIQALIRLCMLYP